MTDTYASDAAHELLAKNPDAPFTAAWFKRGDGQRQFSLRSENHRIDVSEIAKGYGGGGLGTDFDCDGGLIPSISHPLLAKSNDSFDDSLQSYLAFGGNNCSGPVEVSTALQAHAGPMGRQDFASETFVVHSLRADGFDASEDGTGRGTPLVAFSCKDHGADAGPDTAPTLRAMGHDGSHANAGGQVAVAFTQNSRSEVREIGGDGSVVGALAADAGVQQQNYVAVNWAVRRLMPLECERLQGFPDNYTAIPYRGKPAADGPRYKALGNSMAVNCMRWLGRRIDMVEPAILASHEQPRPRRAGTAPARSCPASG